MGERRRDAVDMLVGRNIRILRQDRKMSQTELGRKIDVTFQQVQKYENGTNRVGSGRLFKIASILGVPITAFFEGAHQAASKRVAAHVRSSSNRKHTTVREHIPAIEHERLRKF